VKPLAVRLASFLIDAFPSPFRERFGAEMLGAYLDHREALVRSGEPPWRLDLRTCAGLLRALAAERRRARQRQHHRQPSQLPSPSATMRFLSSDLRQALRLLRAQPGFAAIAIVTLATGIGANTAVFSVLNSVVLAPLPYHEPQQLVRLYSASRERPDAREFHNALDLVDVRDEAKSFASIGVLYTYRETGADLVLPDGHAERVRVLPVGAEYFATLGATPLLGRTFTREEERPDARRVILSHALWSQVAGRDPAVVGQAVVLNGESYEVIGVMRPTLADVVAGEVGAWVPQNLQPSGPNHRGNYYLSAIGRLAPGVSVTQAQGEVDRLMHRLNETFPSGDEERRMQVIPLHEDIVGGSSAAVYILMGAAGLVLLIACLNVANLFLARSLARSREAAIRTALGAARSRLVAQQLVESLVVAAAGGIVGTLVAYLGVKALLAVSPESLARAEEVSFDPLLLGFALAVTMLTGLLFGAGPAYRASRQDPNDALHEGSRGNSAGRSSRTTRRILVASQVSLAMILLVGAGVLIRAFLGLQRTDLGFTSAQVATFEVNLPLARYGDGAARVRLHTALADRLRTLPGVSGVGATSWLPANGKYHHWGYSYLDAAGERQGVASQVRVIDGDFMSLLGIPLVSGRVFASSDHATAPPVALISQSLATRVYGTRDPIGQQFRTGGGQFEVVGVVGNVATEASGGETDVTYLSHDQFAGDRNWSLTYLIKASVSVEEVVAEARRTLLAVDPQLVLHRPRSMDSVLAVHRARDRFVLLLMTVFGGIALTLATVGVYGVLSYLVTQRNHEIGVRLALGARPMQVRRIVMAEGTVLATAGIAVGLLGAAAFSGVLQSLATAARARDPLVFGISSVVLLVAVVAAAYVPARRATRVSPLEALRRD